MLKLQYFGHLIRTVNSLEKTLTLVKIEGRRGRERQTRCLDGITDSMDLSLSKFQQMVKDREAWRAAVHGVTKSLTSLSDWTTVQLGETNFYVYCKPEKLRRANPGPVGWKNTWKLNQTWAFLLWIAESAGCATTPGQPPVGPASWLSVRLNKCLLDECLEHVLSNLSSHPLTLVNRTDFLK